MCCEIIEHGKCSCPTKFHRNNIFYNCNAISISDGAMASRFYLYKSSGSIEDSKKLCDMSLGKIKFVYIKTEALRK